MRAGLSLGAQTGFLASIDNAGEQAPIFQSILANAAFLTSFASDSGGGRYVWIGANDIAAEGDWRWQGSNAGFWSGGTSGTAVGGAYNNWGVAGRVWSHRA